MKPRPTDAEFEVLKAKRDAAISAVVDAFCRDQGWDRSEAHVHVSHSGGCYCACPEGPCQHVWGGKPWQDENSFSVTCSRCGEIALYHDLRFAP